MITLVYPNNLVKQANQCMLLNSQMIYTHVQNESNDKIIIPLINIETLFIAPVHKLM